MNATIVTKKRKIGRMGEIEGETRKEGNEAGKAFLRKTTCRDAKNSV